MERAGNDDAPRLRGVALAATVLLAAACGPTASAAPDVPDPGTPGGPCIDGTCDEGAFCIRDFCRNAPGWSDGEFIPLSTNHDVDVLFVVDNSASMGRAQGLLAQSVPAFVEVLESPLVDASYRIGVTTTDDGNPWCATTSPEYGALQLASCRARLDEFMSGVTDVGYVACTDHCTLAELTTSPTTTELDPMPRSRPWLESIVGRTNVVDATIAEALQCLLPQGIAGCGFESPLESMYQSLSRAQTEGESGFDFVRQNAILAVVIVSDETDCSRNPSYDSIFSTAAMGGNPEVFWSDPNAAQPTSAVCWRAGVVCEGGPGSYDACHAENFDVDGNAGVPDEEAVLQPLARYLDYLEEIEDHKQWITPDQEVVVALVTGVPPGYESGAVEIVYADDSDPIVQAELGIGPGCTNGAVSAVPPVREREVAEAFAVDDERRSYSICADDFAPTMRSIAGAIAVQIDPACMPTCVADTNPDTAVVEPGCNLFEETPTSEGWERRTLPLCEADGRVPDGEDVCYVVLGDPAGSHSTPSEADDMSSRCTELGWNLEFRIVRREGVPAVFGSSITPSCFLSEDKHTDCPLLP